MSSRRPSPPSPQKRTTALKRADGEPLTRFDIQYDVLYNVFHDSQAVFTDPYPSDSDPVAKITFRDLYLKTILHSPKATKALKDKMTDSEMFAEDFAMLALLVNVGRVNTTMSFFPEMKTAIRTYHPIPALQRTPGNLQDAPRIKHMLKSAALKNDQNAVPSTPADILSRVKAGHVPSTTIMNLIFVFANHSAPIGRLHFADKLDFTDLFIREGVSSISRARAFLWLCYHYLESPVEDNDQDYDNDGPINPFSDSGRGNIPAFVLLSDIEILQENVDPEAEKTLAEKLVAQRLEILKTQGAKESAKQPKGTGGAESSVVGDADGETISNREPKPKGKRSSKTQAVDIKEKKGTLALQRKLKEDDSKGPKLFSGPNAGTDGELDSGDAGNQYPQVKRHYQSQTQPDSHNQPRRISTIKSDSNGPVRHHQRQRYSPYPPSPDISQVITPKHLTKYRQRLSTPPPIRSMLEQAWHIVTTTDPLLDSDEEGADEHVRHDYIRRLNVINRLRRKEPTPEPEHYYNSRQSL